MVAMLLCAKDDAEIVCNNNGLAVVVGDAPGYLGVLKMANDAPVTVS